MVNREGAEGAVFDFVELKNNEKFKELF